MTTRPPSYSPSPETSPYKDEFLGILRKLADLGWAQAAMVQQSDVVKKLEAERHYQQHLLELYKGKTKSDFETQYSRGLSPKLPFGPSSLFTKSASSSKAARSDTDSNTPTDKMAVSLRKERGQQLAVEELEAALSEEKQRQEALAQHLQEMESSKQALKRLYENVFSHHHLLSTNHYERSLAEDIEAISKQIPEYEERLERYKEAQRLLYEARDAMEAAMRALPGAQGFLDKYDSRKNNRTGTAAPIPSLLAESFNRGKTGESLAYAEQAHELNIKAHELVEEVPIIPREFPSPAGIFAKNSPTASSYDLSSSPGTYAQAGSNTSSTSLMIFFRGYRLKVEYILTRAIAPHIADIQHKLVVGRDVVFAKQQTQYLEICRILERTLMGLDVAQEDTTAVPSLDSESSSLATVSSISSTNSAIASPSMSISMADRQMIHMAHQTLQFRSSHSHNPTMAFPELGRPRTESPDAEYVARPILVAAARGQESARSTQDAPAQHDPSRRLSYAVDMYRQQQSGFGRVGVDELLVGHEVFRDGLPEYIADDSSDDMVEPPAYE